MVGAAGQAGDAGSSRAPGLASGLRGSSGVHRGDLLLMPQWQYISFFVFNMCCISVSVLHSKTIQIISFLLKQGYRYHKL